MCQPFGTNVTAVCRLPHAKVITGQAISEYQRMRSAGQHTERAPPPASGEPTGHLRGRSSWHRPWGPRSPPARSDPGTHWPRCDSAVWSLGSHTPRWGIRFWRSVGKRGFLCVLPLVIRLSANLNLCEQVPPFQVQKRKILPRVTR